MKYFLLSFILAVICQTSSVAQAKRDTVYCLIGYNATLQDGGTFDGSIGPKCFTKELTSKELEDYIIRANADYGYKMKKVVVLSISYMTKKQYYIFWSKSNNTIQH